MKIRFIPDGGFDKNGAFIEYEGDEPTSDEPQYQRSWYLSFDIISDQMELRTFVEPGNENEEAENPDRSVTKSIWGKGTIQPARWGSFSLSFLGEAKEHHEVSLFIRPNERETVGLGGLKREADLDSKGWNEFYLEIELHTSRFNALVSELSVPGAALKVHVETHKFPNFYATWSPSISDGRIIKYLDSERDVENADDVPEDFWLSIEERKKRIFDLKSAPVNIGVDRPLQSYPKTADGENQSDLDDDYHEFDEYSPRAQDKHTLRIERNNAILAQVDAIALLSAQIKRTGFWVILCLILLVIATLLS
jgi:hypothetical protein